MSLAMPRQLRGVSASGPSDEFFSSVVLLCHLNNDVVDSSNSAHVLTNGAAFTTTAKFGSHSLDLTGVGLPKANTPDSADWHFGSGKFTLEAWAYFTQAPSGTVSVLNQWGNGGGGNLGWFFGHVSGNLAFYYSTTGSDNPNVGSAWSPSLNTWYHLAVDRDASNVLRIYVDGVVKSSATVSATLFNAPTEACIGGSASFAPIKGYIDEARITKGVARYAGAFTAPVAAFPDQ